MAAFRNGLMIGVFALACATPTWAAAQKQLPAPAREQAPPVNAEDLIVNEPHRAWWSTYHAGEAYDAPKALSAHRLFCQDHPSDSTCVGWDWH